jgi:hypothetical protein
VDRYSFRELRAMFKGAAKRRKREAEMMLLHANLVRGAFGGEPVEWDEIFSDGRADGPPSRAEWERLKKSFDGERD